MRVDPMNASRWKHTWGFHNKGVGWDTPMARWAGVGEDWVQEVTTHLPNEDDVNFVLLKMAETFAKLGHRHTHQNTKGLGPYGS